MPGSMNVSRAFVLMFVPVAAVPAQAIGSEVVSSASTQPLYLNSLNTVVARYPVACGTAMRRKPGDRIAA